MICGLSGGVDSAVAAALVHKAIGDQLTCVFVDHGLLRKGEAEQVKHDFVAATGITPHRRRRRRRLPRRPRRRLRAGDASARSSARSSSAPSRRPSARSSKRPAPAARRSSSSCRARSTRTSSNPAAATARPTSSRHHNVGGLPEDIKFQLIEPLRTLFKDEVRAIGTELGLPDEIVWRQPFPGPGLGIRIIGEITKERLDLLREADAIAREELSKAGLDRDIWQCPVVLLADVHSVGVQGDERTYGSPIVLRPVSSEDAMTADWSRVPYDVLATISTRITNECRQINRVVLDCTSKPPATIEWE